MFILLWSITFYAMALDPIQSNEALPSIMPPLAASDKYVSQSKRVLGNPHLHTAPPWDLIYVILPPLNIMSRN